MRRVLTFRRERKGISTAMLSSNAIESRGRSSVPRLPVPSLRQTLQRYLKSLEPFIEGIYHHSRESKDIAIQKRKEWAAKFENGIGKTCQQRLMELDSKSPNNWLDDNFWLKKAYHEVRLPLLIHSNWWLALKSDAQSQSSPLSPIASYSGITVLQLRRAAWLVSRFLHVREKIERNELYGYTNGKQHWARRPSLRIFNRYRIPLPECDQFAPTPPLASPNVRKILVLVNQACYAIEVIDATGRPQHPASIYQSLVVAVLKSHEKKATAPVAIMSSADRNTWAQNRSYLVSLSPQNEAYMKLIEESLFAVALDSPHDVPPTGHPYDRGSQYDSFLHSIRSGRSGHNRWYDKGFTIIVRPDGEIGMSGEHSPCDALVPSMVAEEAIGEPMTESLFDDTSKTNSLAVVQHLNWIVDSKLEKECEKAIQAAKVLIEDSDDSLLWFSEYGTAWIAEAGLSFDPYIQLALQLAYYRDQGHFTAVYETALTRLFLHGRTETVRSFTLESRKFVLAMIDSESSSTTRYSLLIDAIRVHRFLSKWAITGKGIDRHMMGLQLLMEPGESSPLFDDPLFSQSQEWLLSTSGLSEGTRFIGTGFGAPYTNGYGISYMAAPNLLRFGVGSKHSCPHTCTRRFKSNLIESLREMRDVCLLASRMKAHL